MRLFAPGRLAAFVAFVATLPQMPDAWAAGAAERVFARVASSVVTVAALDEAGRTEGQGSGVAIEGGRVVTNCHVVRDARSLRVSSAEGERDAIWTLMDPGRDLCLLAVPGLAAPAVRIRSRESLAVGEPVFAVGNPLGFGLAVSEGLVAAIAPLQGESAIFTNAAQSPGSSGGGLFDADGRLVGITTGIMAAGQNFNLVLPAQWIEALESRGMPARPPAVVPEPERRWWDEAEALRVKTDWAALEGHARDWREAQPKVAAAHEFLGIALFNLGRRDEAEQVLRAALRVDERSMAAWSYLALVVRAAGRKAEAQEALERALALGIGQGYPLYLRAVWLREEGRLEEAQSTLERAITLQPGDIQRWMELGFIENLRKRHDAAARAFRTVLRLEPGHAQARDLLATALARAGKSDQARLLAGTDPGSGAAAAARWIEVGNGDYAANRLADAESAYRKAAAAQPDSHDAWFNLGLVLRRTGREREAVEAFERALAFKPDFVKALLLLGDLQLVRGDKLAALAFARRAAAIDTASADAWRMQARIAHADRDLPECVGAYRKLAALGQSNAADYSALSDCLIRQGEAGAAFDALRSAEKLAPQDPAVLQAFAVHWGRQGDDRRALEYAERAIAGDAGAAAAWSSKGYALLRLRRLPEAIAALETAVRIDPAFANAWINLGQALLLNRELGKAIRALEKAIALAPAAPDAYLYLAQALLGAGQPGRAREQAQAVLSRAPDLPPALALVTLALLAEGKEEEARASFKRLRAKDDRAARALRAQAIASGFPGADRLAP
jgi:tetratricopeptide (TPR) repeat protein